MSLRATLTPLMASIEYQVGLTMVRRELMTVLLAVASSAHRRYRRIADLPACTSADWLSAPTGRSASAHLMRTGWK